MADQRTVKEILASVETILEFNKTNLEAINVHLTHLNDRTNKNSLAIATNAQQIATLTEDMVIISNNGTKQTQKNTNNIGWIVKIGGFLVGVMLLLLVFILQRVWGG
jgi:hypothetical protein